MSIIVRSFILGSYPIRGFLAWASGERDAVFVDPGGWDDAVEAAVTENGLTVRAILLTHGHWDHTGGLATMSAKFGAARVYAHADDIRLLTQPLDIALEGGEVIACGGQGWHVLHVPGHTAGSVAYAAGDVVFTGDALSAGTVGGTPTFAAYERQRHAIRTRLFALGEATRVYPAHGPATTIGSEKRYNPCLR